MLMPSTLMKGAIAGATVLILLLQGRLWAGDDGFREVFRLQSLIEAQTAENSRLSERNLRLEAEVRQLKAGRFDANGGGALEERARADLGLIGPSESFYLFGSSRLSAAPPTGRTKPGTNGGGTPGAPAPLRPRG